MLERINKVFTFIYGKKGALVEEERIEFPLQPWIISLGQMKVKRVNYSPVS